MSSTNQEIMDNFATEIPGLNFGDVIEVGAGYVVPLIDDPNVERDYICFEEALKANVLKFTDTGNINQLKIENTGDKDVLILAGQIVSSPGTQDRIFAETTFIMSHQKVTLTCNCCEASKPISGGTKFKGSVVASPRNIKYCSIMTDVDHYQRQDKIWSKVNSTRNKLKNQGVYSGKSTDKLEEIAVESKKTTKGLLDKAKLVNNQRGVVVLNNDAKIVGVEIFDSPETYKNLHEKIIESYLEDFTDKPKPKPSAGLKSALQKELKSVFANQIEVDNKKDRCLFTNEDMALNGEVVFSPSQKKKKRIVMFRAGQE
ncbi:MAG: hypothetical protein HWN67_23010 [Candidatus Helarchaeota archaeon]|nr:hypothetical protein [Candidatus Helarchaeota archaeon]